MEDISFRRRCNNCNAEFETIYETKKYCKPACAKSACKKRSKARALEGHVKTVDCYDMIEKLVVAASPSPKHFLNKNLKKYGFKKIKGMWCLAEDRIPEFLECFKEDYARLIEIKKLEKEEAVTKKSEKIIRLTEKQLTWEYRERAAALKNCEKLLASAQKHGLESDHFKQLFSAISKRANMMVDYWETDIVASGICLDCNEIKPFYEYYSCAKTLRRGFGTKCKTCLRAISKNNRVSLEQAQEDRRKNYRARLRRLVGVAIRNFVNGQHGEYRPGFGIQACWRAINEKCGYDEEDLVAHLEGQFTPNMNWENQTTPKVPGEYGWQLDHIIAHSSFNYDAFDHPDFAKCWALENLRPLSSIMNAQKGNKDLYQVHRGSFRYGLKQTELVKGGIWRFLTYTNLEAREAIESKFVDGMGWQNHGKVWEMDHIDPLAHLSYLDASDPNFLAVWDISNLQPLLTGDNRSKSSVYMGEKWIHNYGEAPIESKI